ncbi:MAG: mandelate racemase/muconate lactonizing enzyme family protein [Dehalococcoidia bacterium]
MKITEIKKYPLSHDGRISLYIEVCTDNGLKGLGEVGVPNMGKTVISALEHLEKRLIGEDPWDSEKLWQIMFRGNFFPPGVIYSSAIAAIDIALWDLKAKSVDMPLYKLLGGAVREKVVCYPHNFGRGTDALVENCKKTTDEGWKFVRFGLLETHDAVKTDQTTYKNPGILEPTESVKLTTEQFAKIRDAVGDDINICLDVHTRLDTAHVIDLCKRLEEFRPYFIEDPLRSESPHAYRNLSKHTSLPIAAGEQWSSKWQFRQVIEEDLINYARIDFCIAGGITESKKITNWAETHYIDIVPHNPLGAISAAACVSLCMASTNVGVQEMPKRPGTTANDIFPVQISWEDGYAWCNDLPGLGIEFDSEVAEKYHATLDGFPPFLTRNDGAFTNW